MKKHLLLCIYVSAFALAGSLYTVSGYVSEQKKALRQTTYEKAQVEDETRALIAEWYFLNRPDRLEVLAAQYLDWSIKEEHRARLYPALQDMPAHKPMRVPPPKPVLTISFGGHDGGQGQ